MDMVLGVIGTAILIYSWVLIIYILMSWFPNSRETSFGQLLAKICEPYLEPFRRIVPPIGMIDISPIVALFALSLIRAGVISILNIVFF